MHQGWCVIIRVDFVIDGVVLVVAYTIESVMELSQQRSVIERSLQENIFDLHDILLIILLLLLLEACSIFCKGHLSVLYARSFLHLIVYKWDPRAREEGVGQVGWQFALGNTSRVPICNVRPILGSSSLEKIWSLLWYQSLDPDFDAFPITMIPFSFSISYSCMNSIRKFNIDSSKLWGCFMLSFLAYDYIISRK